MAGEAWLPKGPLQYLQVAEALKGLVGEHNFDKDQREVFVYLVSQMRRLTAVSLVPTANSCVLVCMILRSLQQFTRQSNPITGTLSDESRY